MKPPFELPVEKAQMPKNTKGIKLYRIDKVYFPYTGEEADYIVQAINCHEKRYREGYEAGLRAYAWWKEGTEYVGSCGTTLKQALKQAEKH